MSEPFWLTIARRNMHVAETPGKETTPAIERWLINLKAWWRDDETPWCGVFVAECLRADGRNRPQHWYRARAWLDWGLRLDFPTLGCIVVLSRKRGGHVGFYVGHDERGRIMLLGGNQGNRVSIAPFDAGRVEGYRWPQDAPLPHSFITPRLTANGQPSSVNEA